MYVEYHHIPQYISSREISIMLGTWLGRRIRLNSVIWSVVTVTHLTFNLFSILLFLFSYVLSSYHNKSKQYPLPTSNTAYKNFGLLLVLVLWSVCEGSDELISHSHPPRRRRRRKNKGKKEGEGSNRVPVVGPLRWSVYSSDRPSLSPSTSTIGGRRREEQNFCHPSTLPYPWSVVRGPSFTPVSS